MYNWNVRSPQRTCRADSWMFEGLEPASCRTPVMPVSAAYQQAPTPCILVHGVLLVFVLRLELEVNEAVSSG